MPTDVAICVIAPGAVPEPQAEAALYGAAVAVSDDVVADVVGPGALACMQGLLTNDLETAGHEGFVYGAVLTPKGMIICDLWVARRGDAVSLTTPHNGRDALVEVFQRSLPPRLARVTERTESVALRLVGPEAADRAQDAGIRVPENGRAIAAEAAGASYLVARPSQDRPFVLQLTCERGDLDHLLDRLTDAGVVRAEAPALEIVRLLAGWPRLGAEIDHKTLPQEARFDALDGVSYTKGCYTGQETVARLHFRGHANRGIAGLEWEDDPSLDDPQILQGPKTVGRVTSAAWIPQLGRYLGLGMVRREVEPGTIVTAAGRPAQVSALPFHLD